MIASPASRVRNDGYGHSAPYLLSRDPRHCDDFDCLQPIFKLASKYDDRQSKEEAILSLSESSEKWYSGHCTARVDETHLPTVDTSQPVLQAEISPGQPISRLLKSYK
jgi:hypothetical protein